MKDSNIIFAGSQLAGPAMPGSLTGRQRDIALASPMSDDEVARQFGVSPRMIRRLRRNAPKHTPATQRKPMTILASVETITPEIAAVLLGANPDNRKASGNIVEQYAGDMRNGRWLVTGEPVIISGDGLLNDGQHRMMAVCKAGVSVQMMVVRGVERDSRSALGIGKPRSAGDILQMFHLAGGRACAALAAMLMLYENTGKRSISTYRHPISKTAVIERAMADDRLKLCVSFSQKYHKLIPPKHVAFARYVIPDSYKSDAFFDRLNDGIGLDQGNPILVLRNWFFSNGRKNSDQAAAEVILRAWVAYRDSRSLTRLKIMGELPTP